MLKLIIQAILIDIILPRVGKEINKKIKKSKLKTAPLDNLLEKENLDKIRNAILKESKNKEPILKESKNKKTILSPILKPITRIMMLKIAVPKLRKKMVLEIRTHKTANKVEKMLGKEKFISVLEEVFAELSKSIIKELKKK